MAEPHLHNDCCGHSHLHNHDEPHHHPQPVPDSVAAHDPCCGSEPVVAAPITATQHQDGCCGHDHGHSHDHGADGFSLRRELRPIAIAAPLFLAGSIFHNALHGTPFSIAEYAVLIPAYLTSGWGVLTTAGRNIVRGRIFDENFLMTIATLGAIAIHELPEAVGVMLFYQVGELVQGYAVGRSRRSIRALLEVRPDTANLKVNGDVRSVSPETVAIGDLVLVRPGKKCPWMARFWRASLKSIPLP